MYSALTQLPLSPQPTDRAPENPADLFATWFEEINKSGVKEPSSVFLATATKCGKPSCRVVLLKSFDENGFVFYTNANSRKGREINENPAAALCFYWPGTGKQVRLEGSVEKVSDIEADTYFATRSLKSRIGAWASKQSEPMEDSKELLKRVAYYTAKWATGNVKRPPYWTGFRITPDYFEFWRETNIKIPERKVFHLRDDIWYNSILHP